MARVQRRRARAQMLVVVALAMVPILGAVGVGIDVGWIFVQYRLAQNAADAGALAGARAIVVETLDTSVNTAVNTYVAANGSFTVLSASYLDSDGAVIRTIGSGGDIPSSARGVDVSAGHTFDTFFAHIIGIDTFTVSNSAKVMASGVSSIRNTGLWPIAVYRSAFVYDQLYTIWDSETEAPGAAGFLDFNGPPHPAKDASYWFTNGFVPSSNALVSYQYSYPLDYPQSWVWTTEINPPLWIAADPGISASTEPAAASKVGTTQIVLLYDDVYGSGQNTAVRIVGFAAFYIVEVDFDSNPKRIIGQFKRWAAANETGGGDWSTSMIKTVGISR